MNLYEMVFIMMVTENVPRAEDENEKSNNGDKAAKKTWKWK